MVQVDLMKWSWAGWYIAKKTSFGIYQRPLILFVLLFISGMDAYFFNLEGLLGRHRFLYLFPSAVLTSTNWVTYNNSVLCHRAGDPTCEITGFHGGGPFWRL